MESSEARKRFDEQFVRAHRHLFRYIAALLPDRDAAEEVFQDTCLKILEKWRDFDPSRPMVPWACGIARNMAMKHYERNRHRMAPLSEVAVAAVSETQHRLAVEVDRRLARLPDCLERLTTEQRSLLRQCYGQPCSIKAVAEANQLEAATVYKRLERIRRTLFKCIEEMAEE